jgi:hypothetical protein
MKASQLFDVSMTLSGSLEEVTENLERTKHPYPKGVKIKFIWFGKNKTIAKL